jgi:hypothetical protein
VARAMQDPHVRAERLAARYEGRVEALNRFVDELRAERRRDDIPYLDPACGGVEARLLTLLMDPGPMAHGRQAASGMLSWDNDDPTAAEMASQFEAAGIPWELAVPWNASPWPGGADRELADLALVRFVKLLPNLKVCVTCGGDATAAWKRADSRDSRLARIRHTEAPHPSIRGLTRGGRQTAEIGRQALRQKLVEAARSMQHADTVAGKPANSQQPSDPTQPAVAHGSSWPSLVLHSRCARCGDGIRSPERVVVVHRECLLRGLSPAALRDGKPRRAVAHDRSAAQACEVCGRANRLDSLLDVLVHPQCLDKAHRLAGKPPSSRPSVEVCPSCGQPIRPGGFCGCT